MIRRKIDFNKHALWPESVEAQPTPARHNRGRINDGFPALGLPTVNK